MHDSVTVHIDAPAERVWLLVTDIARIGEFSPETFEAEWLHGATAPAVGACFRGHVKRNGRPPTYWTTCRITKCEPGSAFAFTVVVGSRDVNTWAYALRPNVTGTDVTESFELTNTAALRLYWALAGRWRRRTNERGMRTTLERIKTVAESEPSPVS